MLRAVLCDQEILNTYEHVEESSLDCVFKDTYGITDVPIDISPSWILKIQCWDATNLT